MSRFLLIPLSLALLALSIGAPFVAAKNGGNRPNAKLCQHDGWMDLVRAEDGSTFASQDECVSYAAQGGTLTAAPHVPELTLSPGTLYGCNSNCYYGYDFGVAQSATRTFTVTNSGTGATGWLGVFFGYDTGFSYSNDTCGVALAPSGSCSFDVTFTSPGCADPQPFPDHVDIIDFDNSADSIHLEMQGFCLPY